MNPLIRDAERSRQLPGGDAALEGCDQDCIADGGHRMPLSVTAGSSPGSLSLYAHHLLERVDHLDQVALRCHDRVDVLVSAGCLVDHIGVLAAFDTGGCGCMLLE